MKLGTKKVSNWDWCCTSNANWDLLEVSYQQS
jgi:hypothetical protein